MAQISKLFKMDGDREGLGAIRAEKMPETLTLGIFNASGVADEASTAMFDLRATGTEQSYTNAGQASGE